MHCKLQTTIGVLIVGCSLFGLVSCNENSQTKDAITLAADGSKTCSDIAKYYGTLAEEAKETPYLGNAVLNLSFTTMPNSTSTEAAITDVNAGEVESQELAKRQAVFVDLSNVYSAYGTYASSSSSDIQTALAKLETAIETANDGHTLQLTVAGNTFSADQINGQLNNFEGDVVDLMKQRDLRKINSDLEGADTTALAVLESDNKNHLLDQTDFLYRYNAMLFASQGLKAGELTIDVSAPITQALSDTSTKLVTPVAPEQPTVNNNYPAASVQTILAGQIDDQTTALGKEAASPDTKKYDDAHDELTNLIKLHVKFDNKQPIKLDATS